MTRRLVGAPILVLMCMAAACVSPAFEITVDATPDAEWQSAEAVYLKNIRQLTTPDMGITKAGEAYFSPDQRSTIFSATPAGETEYQMHTLALTESGYPRKDTFRMVSPGGGACTCGYFRPDGGGILYCSSYLNPDMPNPESYQRKGSGYVWPMPGGMDILTANLDGSNPQRLTTEQGYDAECAYDATGERIVFMSVRDGDPDLYIMDADGGNVRQLTNRPGYDGGPFFSPDGQRVVFRADRLEDDNLQLFVINADGSGERQLTRNGPVVNWAPFWLPNGKSVLYTTSLHGHHNYEVYLLNIETGKHQRITYRGRFDGLPVVSDDGKRMMWTSQRGPSGTSQIFLADLEIPDGF